MNDFRIIIYIFINLIDFIKKKKNCVKVLTNSAFLSYITERPANDNCLPDNVGQHKRVMLVKIKYTNLRI